MKRLKRKTTVEMLWPYVLNLLRERPMYAYELRDAINEKFGFRPPMVSCYLVLNKLEKQGYTSSEWKDQRGRPARKYYKITPKGMELFKQVGSYFRELAEKLSS